MLGVMMTACGKKTEEKSASTNAPAAGSNPLNAPSEYLGAMAQAQKLAVKTVDLASLNQAIQAFSASEDRWPNDLHELVAKRYLPRLPEPPRGMQFVYDPKSGQVRLTAAPQPPPSAPAAQK